MSKTYDRVLMNMARQWATESHCKRLQVGAVLAIDGRSIMSGYNGMPKGQDNQCETPENTTRLQVIHAEMNVILFCAKMGIATEGSTLYVTHATCSSCAASIFHAGIKEVVYDKDYRDMDGIKELQSYGIKVSKFQI